MASPQQTVPPPHRVKTKARQFWYRVSEGLAVNQLWSQFEKDARSSYRLYSAGLDNLPEERSLLRRVWHISKALFWAILEKLTPARRVLLLVALILLFFSSGGFTYINGDKHVEIQGMDLHVWGGLLMFVVLLLELADRVVMKRDLEIAKDIQAWLLPGAPLQIPGYQIAYATRPANTVAGDYYDVILRPGRTPSEDRILFVVADVAGKSIPAAMLMATFQASLRTLSTSGVALARIGGRRESLCLLEQRRAEFASRPLFLPNWMRRPGSCFMSTPGTTFPFCARNRARWSGWKREASRSGFLRNRLTRWERLAWSAATGW